jgi:hypothetical protein
MPRHAAILIHGIGQERHYEITDDFVQGLALGAKVRSVERIFPRARRDDTNVVTHATRVAFEDSAKPTLDVFEVYWAPLTKGHTTLNMLSWLLLNTFIPGRMVRALSAKNRFVLSYTLSMLGAVAMALAFIYVWLVSTATRLAPALAVGGFAQLPDLARTIASVSWWRILLTALGTYLAFQAAYRVGELYKDWRGPRVLGATRRAERRETIVDALLLLACGAGYWMFRRLADTPFYDFALAYVAYQLVALSLRNYFLNYAGDIQVYVTRDESSNRYAARAAVLSQAIQTLGAVLESQENYARVVLLGHSLGSVVGLDAIRELAARVNSRQLQQGDFDKLAAFVTFGSPLEKTLFFFGRGAPRDDGGTSHFRDHIQAALKTGAGRLEWYNAWYFRDIVADPLTSYGGVQDWPLPPLRNKSSLYLRWVHSDYLRDPMFMQKVVPVL